MNKKQMVLVALLTVSSLITHSMYRPQVRRAAVARALAAQRWQQQQRQRQQWRQPQVQQPRAQQWRQPQVQQPQQRQWQQWRQPQQQWYQPQVQQPRAQQWYQPQVQQPQQRQWVQPQAQQWRQPQPTQPNPTETRKQEIERLNTEIQNLEIQEHERYRANPIESQESTHMNEQITRLKNQKLKLQVMNIANQNKPVILILGATPIEKHVRNFRTKYEPFYNVVTFDMQDAFKQMFNLNPSDYLKPEEVTAHEKDNHLQGDYLKINNINALEPLKGKIFMIIVDFAAENIDDYIQQYYDLLTPGGKIIFYAAFELFGIRNEMRPLTSTGRVEPGGDQLTRDKIKQVVHKLNELGFYNVKTHNRTESPLPPQHFIARGLGFPPAWIEIIKE